MLELLKNLNEKETLELVKKGGVVTESRLHEIEQERQGIFVLNPNITPIRTGTYVEYEGTDCKVTENGKTWECKIPENDGWYESDEHGLPFGKPSSKSSPTARYFWRTNKYSGLLVRGYYVFGDGRRYVDADFGSYVRCGVLIESKSKKR